MSDKSDKPPISDKLLTQDLLRTAAEAKLAHELAPEVRPPGDLLHELQVYQIELEMQNEQLRQAQLALEESRDRYVDLYEFAPVGYLTLARDGTISEINLTGAKLLGDERKKLLRRRFGSFVIREQQERWNQLFADMLQQSETNSFELALEKKDGERMQAHLDCLHLVQKGGLSVVRIAIADITRQYHAEESLRKWHQFVEYASWGMAICDVENQTISLVNPAFAALHGYTIKELIGMKSINLFAHENRKSYLQFHESPLKVGHHALDCMRLRKDGTTFPASVDFTVVQGFDGRTNYITAVKDVTEQKATERRMRDLTAHLQTIREEEKSSIAREIHDDLGGTLTALKMETYWLEDELSVHKKSGPLLKHVESISQLADNAVGVMRRVITGLRPTILDDLGLLAALEWQAGQFYKNTGIACRVNSIEDNVKIDKIRSIALFRIFQETLTNVTRHSGASRVEVEFRCSDDEVMLSASDNGRGLPEGHIIEPTSFGVRGMHERVEQLGGQIKFENAPSGGFCVTVILPLHVDKRKEVRT
ncbi:MAG: PAS domain S-box protein [Gallionella sp.]|nr:PAS domain S-box protein [Gallionella sp.]